MRGPSPPLLTPGASLYVCAGRSVCDYVLSSVPSGSACTNDVLLQFCATSIPFGGVGTSGLGNYHGRFSFHAFTHARGVSRCTMDSLQPPPCAHKDAAASVKEPPQCIVPALLTAANLTGLWIIPSCLG